MLRDNARGFLSKNAPIAHLRQLRDSRDAEGFSRGLWKRFAEMGWTGILVPQDYGGLSSGYVEAGVVMEELGRTLTPSPFLSTALLAATAITRAGTNAQKTAYLPRIAAGDLIAALAVDEGAKHRPEKTALTATRAGDGFTLNGAKTFVVDGHAADLVIVAARTCGTPGETRGLTLLLVNGKAKGLRSERTPMVDSHNSARLIFENVNVAADAFLGEIDAGWSTLEGVLNVGRACVAAELLGAAEEAFSRTVSYLKERKQFGRAYRRVPGPSTSLRAALLRSGTHPFGGVESAANARPIFRRRSRDRFRSEGQSRRHRDTRRAGSGPDARRYRDDRRIRPGLLHEARPRVPGAVRRRKLPRRPPGETQQLLTAITVAAGRS